MARCAAEGAEVSAWHTGFIQEVDLGELLAAADRADAVVRSLFRPGHFVLEKGALCLVLPPDRAGELVPALRKAITIGPHRTLRQDFEFGIAQLVEIALRALSPAINDTFTGLTCIDWLGDVLRTIYVSEALPGAVVGAGGALRLLWSPVRFERLVKAAFDQIRQAGVGNPAVPIRLLQTFTRLATQMQDQPFLEALRPQVEAVWEAVSGEALVRADRDDVEAAYHAARRALGARPGSTATGQPVPT
jgi:uncharacterized membrane protein